MTYKSSSAQDISLLKDLSKGKIKGKKRKKISLRKNVRMVKLKRAEVKDEKRYKGMGSVERELIQDCTFKPKICDNTELIIRTSAEKVEGV